MTPGPLALIEDSLTEMLAAPERMAPEVLSGRRLFVAGLTRGGLGRWIERAEAQHPTGLGDLVHCARLLDQGERYSLLRERHMAMWFEEKETVAAQIEQAFDRSDPPRLWAGFLLLILFRDIVVRRVEYRFAPDRPPPRPPSAFVYCMQ
jgi:hypothetical protein